MSSKRGEAKKSSFRSKPWRPFSRKSSKKKKDQIQDDDDDDVGRRLAMASVPAATADYTPGSNVFRADTLQQGRFRLPESPSQSVTSLEVVTGESETANSVSVATGDDKQAESETKDNNEAAERSGATVSEIRAITEKIAQLQKGDDDKESEDDSSDSDGEIESIPREMEEQEKPVEVSVFNFRYYRK